MTTTATPRSDDVCAHHALSHSPAKHTARSSLSYRRSNITIANSTQRRYRLRGAP